MFSSIMVESSPSSISLVRFSSMREIMNRFRQWFFFKPLRPTLRKAAIKLKTKSTKDKRIPKYKGKINLLKSEPQKPGKKINPKPQKVQEDFQPPPLPQTQAQPITQVVAPRLSKSYFPMDRVTPLQIEEDIHHLTREIDSDGEHTKISILSSLQSASLKMLQISSL